MSFNVQGSPDAKKPCKGILKTSSSFDRHSTSPAAASQLHRKSAKFDELNVLQTYHPPDKDYGHMKIEEPKTPYNFDDGSVDQLDAELLAEKLQMAADAQATDDETDDEPEDEESRTRRIEFEKRRKAHYNEYEAVRLARRLIEEDEDDDENDGNASANPSTSTVDEVEKMEVDHSQSPSSHNSAK